MSQNKTKPNDGDIENFLNSVEDPQRREDAKILLPLMAKWNDDTPKMWGTSIIGFGEYHYKYASGREGDHLISGFSPRKGALTIYIMDGFKNHTSLMEKLGKYKTGSSCLYVKKLDDINIDILEKLVKASCLNMASMYETKKNNGG